MGICWLFIVIAKLIHEIYTVKNTLLLDWPLNVARNKTERPASEVQNCISPHWIRNISTAFDASGLKTYQKHLGTYATITSYFYACLFIVKWQCRRYNFKLWYFVLKDGCYKYIYFNMFFITSCHEFYTVHY